MAASTFIEGDIVVVNTLCEPGCNYGGLHFNDVMSTYHEVRLVVVSATSSKSIRLDVYIEDRDTFSFNQDLDLWLWSDEMLHLVTRPDVATVERIHPAQAIMAFEIAQLVPSRRTIRSDSGNRADPIWAINIALGGSRDTSEHDWIKTMWGESYIAGFDAGFRGATTSSLANRLNRNHVVIGNEDGHRVWMTLRLWRDDGYPPAKEWIRCNLNE